MKIYITSEAAISPWDHDFSSPVKGGAYQCIEPNYSDYLDPRAMRRMSRIMKMGLTTALTCLNKTNTGNPDAIITATALGCLEDTAAFLNKLSHKDGQLLNPTPFIQSTHNTVGGAIALQLKCNSYNNTFSHQGFSFESAITDAQLLLRENQAGNILLGALDELIEPVSTILNQLRELKPSNKNMAGSGEGVIFFNLSGTYAPNALELAHFETLFNPTADILASKYSSIVECEEKPDVILAGINGSFKNDKHYNWLLSLEKEIPVIAYKNYCGEYPTASAFAHWLACHMLRNGFNNKQPESILIYNHFEGRNHSFSVIKK